MLGYYSLDEIRRELEQEEKAHWEEHLAGRRIGALVLLASAICSLWMLSRLFTFIASLIGG